MSATFGDVPVSAIFDGNAATSSLSLEWVMGSGLRTRNSRASGLLSLPCNTGFIFMCLNDIPVAASSPSDLVLGLDWFQFVWNSTSELVVHLSSGPLDLRHHPLPTVGGESIGSSSVTPVFRGDIGVDPSSSSSASQGRPDLVLTHSCTPGTRGVADPPVLNSNDDVLPMNNLFRNEPFSVSSPDHLPFARLDLHDKTTVHMRARDSSDKKKSADALRAEFFAHQCTESCSSGSLGQIDLERSSLENSSVVISRDIASLFYRFSTCLEEAQSYVIAIPLK
ncbi:hypothetical protein B0H13DRAFT_2283715 [Mycena leptocephala]|nr:hypothetical protein B0H13DRAFT_2283715 [Mycena leptocephala]